MKNTKETEKECLKKKKRKENKKKKRGLYDWNWSKASEIHSFIPSYSGMGMNYQAK